MSMFCVPIVSAVSCGGVLVPLSVSVDFSFLPLTARLHSSGEVREGRARSAGEGGRASSLSSIVSAGPAVVHPLPIPGAIVPTITICPPPAVVTAAVEAVVVTAPAMAPGAAGAAAAVFPPPLEDVKRGEGADEGGR